MLYLDEQAILRLGVGWPTAIDTIAETARIVRRGDYAQPIKPYLRYRDQRNRIIAMPAFVGGAVDMAGIKWIASFPGNLERGAPRASCVTILNDATTGQPHAVVNTGLISVIRTAAVSGLMLRRWREVRGRRRVRVGIAGWGPIGRQHARMCAALLGGDLAELLVYDVRPIAPETLDGIAPAASVAGSWREAYDDADVFITCTVSSQPYIDRRPKQGSLQLNVSLRDYRTSVFPFVREGIVVDDWDEVCREATDIELMHRECGLVAAQTRSLFDLVDDDRWLVSLPREAVVMFNPMGMAVFDIAIAAHYVETARFFGVGLELS